MASRYYFLSSLSMLRFSDSAPMSWEDFLSQAKGNVSESDYKTLSSIAEGGTASNAFLKKWEELNRKLDDAVNERRRKARNRDHQSSGVFRDFDIEKVTNAALNAKDPLEAELVLMRFRYDWLEVQKGFEPFSETSLLCYALQLRILLRRDLFNVEAGNEQFRSMFDNIQKELKVD